MGFPPNINPELFSILGAVTGIIVEGDYTANELNSIGNWIILVGQFMLTTAAQQQLINGRYQNNNGSRIRSNANNHSANNKQYSTYEQLQQLANYLKKLEEKIEEMLKKYRKCQLVITDRLHGMIFATITSTPCIALGNYNHKIKSCSETLEPVSYTHLTLPTKLEV